MLTQTLFRWKKTCSIFSVSLLGRAPLNSLALYRENVTIKLDKDRYRLLRWNTCKSTRSGLIPTEVHIAQQKQQPKRNESLVHTIWPSTSKLNVRSFTLLRFDGGHGTVDYERELSLVNPRGGGVDSTKSYNKIHETHTASFLTLSNRWFQ